MTAIKQQERLYSARAGYHMDVYRFILRSPKIPLSAVSGIANAENTWEVKVFGTVSYRILPADFGFDAISRD